MAMAAPEGSPSEAATPLQNLRKVRRETPRRFSTAEKSKSFSAIINLRV
jgi:hypothetical protein